MSAEDPSKCCFCREPTSKRCQACAKSGIDFFFCSPEHQKLVWKHHKEVCGPNAPPFRYPPFSQDEVDELLALEHQPVTHYDTEDVSVLIDRFPEVPAFAREIGTDVRGGLEFAGWLLQRFRPFPRQAHSRGRVRWDLSVARAYQRAQGAPVPQSAQRCPYNQLWIISARFDNRPLVTTASSGPPGFDDSLGAHWLQLSRYRHQAVVLVSLALTKQLRGPAAVPTQSVLAAFEQAFACLNELNPFVHAAHAEEILRSVSEILNCAGLQQLGVYRDQAGKLACTCVCA